VLVYLHEAHADDVWPLGYGVKNPTSLAERWAQCDALVARLRLDVEVFVDGMDNAFLHAHGAWPERYFFVEQGAVVWASDLWAGATPAVLDEAEAFARANGWC